MRSSRPSSSSRQAGTALRIDLFARRPKALEIDVNMQNSFFGVEGYWRVGICHGRTALVQTSLLRISQLVSPKPNSAGQIFCPFLSQCRLNEDGQSPSSL